MPNYIDLPAESQDKAGSLKNVLGQVAVKPFYIWANDDCANMSDSFSEAKTIRLALFNEDCESVYIVDANGVEVLDSEIECHEALAKSGYFAGARKPEVKPGFAGAFMVNDLHDPDGFAIVGHDVGMLILEAQAQLIDPPIDRKMPKIQMVVTETYTNTFEVEAEDEDQAINAAATMSVERSFPQGHVERCNRTIAIKEKA